MHINIYNGSYFLDPLVNNRQLHVVIKDLEEELKLFWDKLPIDTVVASILDPRTKKYHKIPPHEINEAVKIIKLVCIVYLYISTYIYYY